MDDSVPIHVAIILPSSSKLPVQFDAYKVSVLASDTANVLDDAIHVARHVDRVTHFQALCIHPDRRGIVVVIVGALLTR